MKCYHSKKAGANVLSPFCHFLFGYGYVHNDWIMIRVLKSKISCLNCVDGKIIRNDKSIDHVILEYAWITVVAGKWTTRERQDGVELSVTKVRLSPNSSTSMTPGVHISSLTSG